jgi:hypothetical protein
MLRRVFSSVSFQTVKEAFNPTCRVVRTHSCQTILRAKKKQVLKEHGILILINQPMTHDICNYANQIFLPEIRHYTPSTSIESSSSSSNRNSKFPLNFNFIFNSLIFLQNIAFSVRILWNVIVKIMKVSASHKRIIFDETVPFKVAYLL